jgi:hypothetical protein
VPVAPALIQQVRDYVGSTPDDIAVEDVLVRTDENVRQAALSILRRRRADLIESPGKLSIDQDYSRETTKVQLDALDAQIAALLGEIDAEDGVVGDDGTGLPQMTTATLSRCADTDDEWPGW